MTPHKTHTVMATTPEFVVETSNPVLVAPAGPTPHEFKHLSDIDQQLWLRTNAQFIQYYEYQPKMAGKDPGKTIREAVAKALVWYYPFAGGLREVPGTSNLMVECTGEGVLFVEADASVTLERLGDRLPPPLPWLGKFLDDVPDSDVMTGSPLMLIQVTRLACGGFVVALCVNHTMCDAQGMAQFLHAVGELTRGTSSPTVPPAWERHLLTAPHMPVIKAKDVEEGVVDAAAHDLLNLPIQVLLGKYVYCSKFPYDQVVHRSFFFRSHKEIHSLKHHQSDRSTAFEVLAAATWRSRTMALRLDPDEDVYFVFLVNYRSTTRPPLRGWPRLPDGYYGNALMNATAASTAGQLCRSPLSYAVQLIKKAKSEVLGGSVDPVVDMVALMTAGAARVYCVSDNTHTGLDEVDYGWGKPKFGSLASGNFGSLVSVLVPFKNSVAETGVVVPICLPEEAMGRFVAEVEMLIGAPVTEPHGKVPSSV